MKPIKTILFVVILATSSVYANEKKAPTLKSVMAGLSDAMSDLGKGIFYEDFKLIEKAAGNVVEHPKPKGQLPKIVWALKFRMMDFKKLDGVVHDSAKDIVELAKKKDMQGILKKHAIVVNGCIACHDKFRDEISNLFTKK